MKFEIKRCGFADWETILQIQEEVFSDPFTRKCLHRNTPELLRECLSDPHLTLGAFCGDYSCADSSMIRSGSAKQLAHRTGSSRLAAFGVLYVPTSENHFGRYLQIPKSKWPGIANLKLVIVLSEYRGQRLQKTLMEALIEQAENRGLRGLYSTAHPDNVYSIRNILNAGFVFKKRIDAYEENLPRNLYFRDL